MTILRSSDIRRMLSSNEIAIQPTPYLKESDLFKTSVNLRLGRWFASQKINKANIVSLNQPTDDYVKSLRKHSVPFGSSFILHPSRFVLGATLEWISIGDKNAGFVMGKSSHARKGLVIEAAPGVHPGFSGTLTLELHNVGEVPLLLAPGDEICQLYLLRASEQEVSQNKEQGSEGEFHLGHSGMRRPFRK